MPHKNRDSAGTLAEATVPYTTPAPMADQADVDIPLLEESLRMSPWERMLANDDALNFGESLRVAMEKRNAKP
jgi:hypothetical protein